MCCDSDKEEKKWILEAQEGKRAAVEKITDKYYGFLCTTALRIAPYYALKDDLIQAGYLGLFRALQRFDVNQSVRFLTYALPWILGEMKKIIRMYGCRPAIVSLEAGKADKTSLEDILRSSNGIDFMKLDLHLAIRKLSREEQLLICLRYFRDKSQNECALLLQRSQTQISRIERKAIEKLQAMLM